MKLKRLLSITLCFLCVLAFTGCGRNVSTSPLTMDRYFNSKVTSKYSTNSTKSYNLSSFTAQNTDENTLALHKSLQFTGVTNWLYSMYLECVYFYFYSTKSVEVNQLKVTVTALDGGITDLNLPDGTYKVEQIVSFNASKNKGVLVRVDIGKNVCNSDLTLTLALEDENLLNTDFSWTIYGLQTYGETR